MDLQPIFDIAETCFQKGIRRAIISPGSRNAPLTLAFTRHEGITCYSIPDERSAGFIALGMSLKSKAPTVLICTSGSAGLNYTPAIAEAYFAQIPLLILTADRPPEWIGQLDGQTVFQKKQYGNHIKKSYEFPSSFDYPESQWYCHRIINEAINISTELPSGPVHINLPFREPFYPESNKTISYSKNIKIINTQLVAKSIKFDFHLLDNYDRIIIINGQLDKNPELILLLSEISSKLNIPIITDVISNGHDIENNIKHQDLFLKNTKLSSTLKPDLIITFGLSVISKNLKLFLRKNMPKAHWHIQSSGNVADTFQSLTDTIRTDSVTFFKGLKNELSGLKVKNGKNLDNWKDADFSYRRHLHSLLEQQSDFNEFTAYNEVISALPKEIDLHLANSMAVRYVNFIGLYESDIEVFCNRGTSGIDGSNSTAVGSAISTSRTTILLTGDMAFFYDRNAFWHNHLPKNLKIIVFNNNGGGIFRMIDGPAKQPELEEYFETKQLLSAEILAQEYNMTYHKCMDKLSLQSALKSFFTESDAPSILEIQTNSNINQKVYKEIMTTLGQLN